MVAGTSLIGRDAELAALGEAFETDRATVLVGEAGVGKTALVRAVAARADRVLREGGAFATLRATPYLALRRAVDRAISGDPATVAARLERAIGPDLLFIDDAQWADDATLAAVALLAGRIALVAAVRSLDPGAAHALEVLVAAGAAVHDIRPLSGAAARELVRQRRPELPPRVVDDIVRRAAGNPLLLEEMADGGEATPVLARVMTSRLDQLSPAARDAVELLAIAERPIPREQVAAAAEALDAGVVVEAAAGLEIRHQLVGDAVRSRLDDARRRGLHGRVADLALDDAEAARHLAAAGRREDAAALALRGLRASTDPRERAALLLIAAEASAPAASAAHRLEAARGLDEVADWAGVMRALGALPSDAPAEVHVEAAALLAHAAFSLGDVEACRRHIVAMDAVPIERGSPADVRRSIEAATFLVNVDGAVEAAIRRLDALAAALPPASAGGEDVAALRASIVLLATGRGDVDRIRAAADGAFDAGRFRTATDRGRVVQYYLNMAVGSQPALAFLLERAARYDRAGLGSLAHDFLSDAVVAAVLSGRFQDAVTTADRLLEEPALTRPRQTASIHRGRALVLLGRIDDGEAALAALRPTATADFFGLGDLLTAQAEAAFWAGRPDVARQRAEAALSIPAPLPVALAQARLQLAWACRELHVEPPGPIEVASTPSAAGANIEFEAIAAESVGAHVEAAAAFTAAAAAWDRFHEPRALICRWAAGESLGRAGEQPAAIEALRDALAAAEAMRFEPLAARLRRSLRLLGVRVPPKLAAASPRLGLTAREGELVALVERGMTNVEISRRLGLGRPTVARMLGSAMVKLGVGSRAELVAVVPRASR
jgi:DNA-binding CsgD family transcriptional regulator